LRFKFKARPGRKLCPRCLSVVKPATFISGWLLPEEYVCEACGYVGHVSLEAVSKGDEKEGIGEEYGAA